MSPMVVEIYWNGLQTYSFDEVNAAINAHVRNPDTGQFMPKIADVERFLHGNTGTRAMAAWVAMRGVSRGKKRCSPKRRARRLGKRSN
jgi:hypothetical protein